MKLYVRNGRIPVASFFKFAFVGVLIGEGLFMALFFIPTSVIMLTAGTPVEGNVPPEFVWLFPLMFPIIVLMHALMFGGLILLGLWVFSRFGKLEIAEEP